MQELNMIEVDEVGGGFAWVPAIFAAIAVYDALSDIKEGFQEQWAEIQKGKKN